MNEKIGIMLGEFAREVLEVDTSEDQLAWGKWLRVRVNINVHKPLKRGKVILVGGERKVLTWFKYDKLPDYYYIYGTIDHHELDCKVVVSLQKEQKKLHREFRSWLRADGTSVASMVFGKLKTNASGQGSFTK